MLHELLGIHSVLHEYVQQTLRSGVFDMCGLTCKVQKRSCLKAQQTSVAPDGSAAWKCSDRESVDSTSCGEDLARGTTIKRTLLMPRAAGKLAYGMGMSFLSQ